MSKSDNPLRLEIIIFFLLALIFLMWAFKQCNTERDPRERPRTERKKRKSTKPAQEYSTLYVIVDSLNMRTAPHLDSLVIRRMPRKEKVEFYGLRTSFRQKININSVTRHEPWVYIRTKNGREGWVYAGGLSFYKN